MAGFNQSTNYIRNRLFFSFTGEVKKKIEKTPVSTSFIYTFFCELVNNLSFFLTSQAKLKKTTIFYLHKILVKTSILNKIENYLSKNSTKSTITTIL